MLKMLSGLAFGYFLYTKEGREQLSSLGTYITDSIKSSFKDLDKMLKKENNDGRNSEEYSKSSNGRIESSEILHR